MNTSCEGNYIIHDIKGISWENMVFILKIVSVLGKTSILFFIEEIKWQ